MWWFAMLDFLGTAKVQHTHVRPSFDQGVGSLPIACYMARITIPGRRWSVKGNAHLAFSWSRAGFGVSFKGRQGNPLLYGGQPLRDWSSFKREAGEQRPQMLPTSKVLNPGGNQPTNCFSVVLVLSLVSY